MLHNKQQIIYEKITIFLIAFLYPILPQNYYVIGPLSMISFTSLLAVFLLFVTHHKFKIVNVKQYNILFWTYIAIYCAQILATVGILSSISYFVTYLVICILFISIVDNQDTFLDAIDGIILCGLVLGILGIVEALSGHYIFQGSLLNEANAMRYGVLRASTTFGHPINFGIYESIVAILTFYRLNTTYDKKYKLVYVISYIVAIISLILTVSRLAICLFLSAQLLLLLQMGTKKFVKYISIGGLVIVLLLTMFSFVGFGITNLVFDFISSILDVFGKSNASISSTATIGFGNRFDLYNWVFEAVKGHELFGLGVGAEFAYKMYDWFTKTSIEVHYLYVYYKCGLVGLVSLVASYIGTLFFIMRNIRKGTLNFENKISFLGMLVVLLLSYYICMFGVQETDTTRIYNILVCLGICYIRVRKHQSSK